MADRKLIVTIAGDDRQFQAALKRSSAAAKKFSNDVGDSLGRRPVSTAANFGPLLKDIESMKDRAATVGRDIQALDEGLQGAGRSAGRFGGSLGGAALKAGALGIAVTTAYQASRRLNEALTVTGSAAFKTEGKLRNMAAALVQGDLVGGIAALAASPKTFEDLGISITEARNRLDEISAAGKLFGGDAANIAREVRGIIAAMDAAENSAAALADATARLGTAFVTSTGQAVTFKGAVDDLGGLRGPGLADAINTALEAASGPSSSRIARNLRPGAKNAAAQVIAAANEDLSELLRLQKIERARLQNIVNQSHGNLEQREQQNQDLAQGRAAVIRTERLIKDQADAQARASALALEAARREAEAARREAAARAKALAARAKAAAQAREFRQIGLSSTGDEITPSLANLRKQFSQLETNVIGQDVPRKLLDRMRVVGKFLSSGIDSAREQTRAKIRDLFRDIRQTFDAETNKGPLTKTTSLNANRLLEGLGLGRDAEKELRARLSSFNSAGKAFAAGGTRPTGSFVTPTIVVENHNTTTLDGDVVGRSVTKSQQRAKRRNPKQKSGPNAGV